VGQGDQGPGIKPATDFVRAMRHLTRQADIRISLGCLRFRLSCSASVHQIRVITDAGRIRRLARPVGPPCVVTGGGGGIGRTTALSFAKVGAASPRSISMSAA